MKSRYSWFLILVLFLGITACRQKALPPPDAPEAYVGVWKVTDPQGQVFYMTLKADGSGTTTREGGEIGTWKIKGDHLESQWLPKQFRIYFSEGKTKPLLGGPSVAGKTGGGKPWIAEKVEKIPD